MKSLLLSILLLGTALPGHAMVAYEPEQCTGTQAQYEALAQVYHDTIKRETDILATITDKASADAAVEQLQECHSEYMRLQGYMWLNPPAPEVYTWFQQHLSELCLELISQQDAEMGRIKKANYFGSETLKQLIEK